MASPIQARTLKGFRDSLPQDMLPRKRMLHVVEATFARHGFAPLDTPALEYAEVLTGKYGQEGDKLLYRFEDHGSREVAMRYDLTVPLARVVAQHRAQLPTPFRRYHIGSVWRADKPQRGRFREFMQCDVDIVGAAGPNADVEILATGLTVLSDLGVADARIHLNHRGLLSTLLSYAGLDEPRTQLLALRAIDKWDKVGVDGVRSELRHVDGVTDEMAERLLTAFSCASDDTAATLQAMEELVGPNDAIDRLRTVLHLLEASGFPAGVVIDPTIARGLDYYTGVIYETRLTHPQVSGIGAVMSGGRYDGLIGMFGKEQIPAVGISLGLDRLLAALKELGLSQPAVHGADVFVAVFNEECRAVTFSVARRLRDAGLSSEVSTVEGKLAKQFKRADARGCRVVVVVGPDEVRADQVLVKELATGQQHRVATADLVKRVGDILCQE